MAETKKIGGIKTTNSEQLAETQVKITNNSSAKVQTQVKPFSDTTELTLLSAYYPETQPFLASVKIEFPGSLTEAGAEGKEAVYTNLDTPNLQLDVRPQHLLSFTFNRTETHRDVAGIGSFTLVLFDPTWGDIENLLKKSEGYFRFKYGYLNEASKTNFNPNSENISLESPWTNCQLTNYSVKFFNAGVQLTLQGVAYGHKILSSKGYKTNSGILISDYVKQLAEANDLDTSWIEPTAAVVHPTKCETTEFTDMTILQNGDNFLNYVKDKLVVFAINEKGEGDYRFWIENKGEEKDILHFHTLDWRPATSKKETILSLTLFKTKDTPLINYEPDSNFNLVRLLGTDSTFSSIIDINQKTVKTINIRKKLKKTTETDASSNEAKLNDSNTKAPELKDKDSTTNNRISSHNVYQSRARNSEELKADTITKVSSFLLGSATATVTLVGTPNFAIAQKIAVIVYRPQEGTVFQNYIHPLSGYYNILGITENISSGTYITVLNLANSGDGQLEDSVSVSK